MSGFLIGSILSLFSRTNLDATSEEYEECDNIILKYCNDPNYADYMEDDRSSKAADRTVKE
jgi:hypothetical protein